MSSFGHREVAGYEAAEAALTAALARARAEGEAAGLARGRAEATASIRLAAAATESQVERCALSRAADTMESWAPTAPAEGA